MNAALGTKLLPRVRWVVLDFSRDGGGVGERGFADQFLSYTLSQSCKHAEYKLESVCGCRKCLPVYNN